MDTIHTAFTTRFRRMNEKMFLAVYNRDAALSVEALHSILNDAHITLMVKPVHTDYQMLTLVMQGRIY